MKKYILSIVLGMALLFGNTAEAQLTMQQASTTANPRTAQQILEEIFVGAGVQISNAQFNGYSTPLVQGAIAGGGIQLATFTNNTAGFPEFPFANGLMMTTGRWYVGEGPNNVGGGIANAQDGNKGKSYGITYTTPIPTELTSILGIPSNKIIHPATLEFDFVTSGDHVSFNYIFASEEYPEFSCSPYNDVFGFFVTDLVTNTTQNIALIPNSTDYVSINNIHPYVPGQYSLDEDGYVTDVDCPASHAEYFTPVPLNSTWMQYDGFVGAFSAEMDVVPCRTYHMKLVISNVYDNNLGSAVFLEAESFNSNSVSGSISYQYTDQEFIVPGCFGADITFSIPNPAQQDTVINLSYSGTAVNGTDIFITPSHTALPTSITIPEGDSTYTMSVDGYYNGGYNEEPLVLTITYSSTECEALQTGQIDIYIMRDAGVGLSDTTFTACEGSTITGISPTLDWGSHSTVSWQPPTYLSSPTSFQTNVSGSAPDGQTYTVTVWDKYHCNSDVAHVTIERTDNETIVLTDQICQGETYTDNGFNIACPTAGTFTYTRVENSSGCTQTYQLTLTVVAAEVTHIYDTACNSYTWHDNTYTSSGTYTYNTPGSSSGGGGTGNCKTEDFESYTAGAGYSFSPSNSNLGDTPTGWNLGTSNTYPPRVMSGTGYSSVSMSSQYLLFPVGGYAIAPYYSNITSIEFYYKCETSGSTYGGTIEVGYVTNASDISTFQSLGTLTLTKQLTLYTLSETNINTINANNGYFAIRYTNTSMYGFGIDDLTICNGSSSGAIELD